ncbi:DUF2087 domain-containing protein [Streptomyces sp. A7024]|uniref:DUF2087 domain-containing protein n=1 Tax=Streptomyces coryli TaxID=1128680 RepID=A0A6G4UD87_9ACTN|nr:DUF2087 domain-containing protein [Streptomyces coryli]
MTDTHAPVPDLIRGFLRDGRLLRLPAKYGKQLLVLDYLATNAFEPGRIYDEAAVNDILRGWCEGGATDHVAVRRALVDSAQLVRDPVQGWYWRADGLEA